MILHWSAVVALLFLTGGCSSADEDENPAAAMADSIEAIDPAMLAGLPGGTTIETLEQGRELFVVCTVCHGLDANGTQLGPSLRDTAWIHITPDIPSIANLVRAGVPSPTEYPIPMPVMGGGDFDETELQSLATYVYALGQSRE